MEDVHQISIDALKRHVDKHDVTAKVQFVYMSKSSKTQQKDLFEESGFDRFLQYPIKTNDLRNLVNY